jgi:hypothetical protein
MLPTPLPLVFTDVVAAWSVPDPQVIVSTAAGWNGRLVFFVVELVGFVSENTATCELLMAM